MKYLRDKNSRNDIYELNVQLTRKTMNRRESGFSEL